MRVKEFLTKHAEKTINEWLKDNEEMFDLIDFKVVPLPNNVTWVHVYILYEQKQTKSITHLPSLDLPKEEFREQLVGNDNEA